MDNVNSKDDNKGFFLKIVYFIFGSFYGFLIKPYFLLLDQNKILKNILKIKTKTIKDSKIDENDPVSWYPKQIRRNIIIIISVLVLNLLLSYKAISVISNDDNLFDRIDSVKNSSFLEYVPNIVNVIVVSEKDSHNVILNKFETKFRLKFMLNLFFIIMFVQGLFYLIVNFSVITIDSEYMKDVLRNKGFIRKEDEDEPVLLTPYGAFIYIGQHNAREFAHSQEIWSSLNIKIKDWIEDPTDRRYVFFEKAYELKPTLYIKVPEDSKKIKFNLFKKQ